MCASSNSRTNSTDHINNEKHFVQYTKHKSNTCIFCLIFRKTFKRNMHSLNPCATYQKELHLIV